jgi:hypothetical protein
MDSRAARVSICILRPQCFLGSQVQTFALGAHRCGAQEDGVGPPCRLNRHISRRTLGAFGGLAAARELVFHGASNVWGESRSPVHRDTAALGHSSTVISTPARPLGGGTSLGHRAPGPAGQALIIHLAIISLIKYGFELGRGFNNKYVFLGGSHGYVVVSGLGWPHAAKRGRQFVAMRRVQLCPEDAESVALQDDLFLRGHITWRKGGTQTVDGYWKTLRRRVAHRGFNTSMPVLLHNAILCHQWSHWAGPDRDLFAHLGATLELARERDVQDG